MCIQFHLNEQWTVSCDCFISSSHSIHTCLKGYMLSTWTHHVHWVFTASHNKTSTNFVKKLSRYTSVVDVCYKIMHAP